MSVMSAIGGWIRDHWLALTAAVAGLAAAALLWRQVRRARKQGVPAPGPVPLPDPTPALAPLEAAQEALDAADAATRAGGEAAAEVVQGGHDAIDAAKSIGAVDAVLYGRDHTIMGVGPGDAASTTNRRAPVARRRKLPDR